jgi:hypothetical protein
VIGIYRGAVLSSSLADAAVVLYLHDPPRNTSGNALLSRVLPPNNNATYDSVTLRLSFSCTRPSTRVQFCYVFGSNEFAYTLAHGRSNDVMGAFLNGKKCPPATLPRCAGLVDGMAARVGSLSL